jgi:hypothetical protein
VAIYNARTAPNKKALKKQVFNKIRSANGLQGTAKLGIRNIINPDNENYGVLYDKRTKVDLNDGRPDPVVERSKAVQAPKTVPNTATVTAVAPVKKAPVVAPKPTAKASKAIPDHSPVRTYSHQYEVRATIDGVRKRLGFAKDDAAKARIIAAAKSL